MRRRAFLAICGPPGADAPPYPVADLHAEVERTGTWACVAELPGLTVWTDPSRALPIQLLPRGAGVVLGEIWPVAEAAIPPWAQPSVDWKDPPASARHLCAAAWGAYAAILRDPAGRLALFREPTGQLPAYGWTLRSGAVVIASDPRCAPARLSPPDLSIHWDRVWRFAAAPSTATDRPLLDGLQSAAPGELVWLHAPAASQTIWTPAAFASRPAPEPAEAAGELLRRVDRSVTRALHCHERLLVEVSGGLDSAIVAGSIAAAGETQRVAAWINLVGAEREADEARYAQAVADRAGVPLQRIGRRARPLDLAEIEELAQELWPTMAAVEPDRDRLQADLAKAHGASAIVSGEGGDAAFFQMPSPAVFADALRARGPAALASPLLAHVARRTRRSVWGVLTDLRNSAERTRGSRRSPYVAQGGFEREHAWVEAAVAADLPPGKRLQVAALAALHLHQADSRRRAVADMLFPLFSQPVMELCLAIPSYVLAGASYDRPFARHAFAQRLPPEVLWRRGKGDHSVHYGHVVAHSLEVLRPYLLEGSLCAAGVLDRAALERALDAERLIWGERPVAILWATAIEAWVRAWQRQVPDALSSPRPRPRDARRGS